MKVFVTMKQIGRKRDWLTRREFELDSDPKTLEELIIAFVKLLVQEYNAKKIGEPTRFFKSEEELQNAAELTGRVAFNVRYNEKQANETESVLVAIQAYKDGLFRVFLDDNELTELDAPINPTESQTFTFVRLVMLAGRLW